MLSKMEAERLAHDVWEHGDKRKTVIQEFIADYKERAMHNINKVTKQDRDTLTERDIKKEFAEYFHDEDFGELLVESMEWVAAKLSCEIHNM
jgi:hypothetical protein